MRALLLLLILCAAAAQAQPRPATVALDAARLETLRETTSLLGRIVPARRAAIAAQVAGVVEDAPAEVGDAVAAGDALARIDAEPLRLAVEIARAALAEAEAGRDAAKADVQLADTALQRISKLRGSSAFSSAALEDRRSEAARAKGRLLAQEAAAQSARARLARAEFDLDRAVIRAPFSGVVVEARAEPGAWLSTGATVATLLDLSALELELDLSAERAAALAPGDEIAASVAGRPFRARLRAIIPEEDPASRTRPARFALIGDGAGLAAGQSASAEIPLGRAREAVTIDKDAVAQSGDGPIVFVVEDGVARARAVTLGAVAGARVEASGVKAGEMLVSRGNERLSDEQAVREAGLKAQGGG